jgi:beta-glucanase (GH16 family)
VAWGNDRRYEAVWRSRKVPFAHFTGRDGGWAQRFHVWRMDWDEQALRLYLDDELLNEVPLSETVNGKIGKGTNPFLQPHYVLLNLALGGLNGGKIDDNSLPMRYEIDYVRIYQNAK